VSVAHRLVRSVLAVGLLAATLTACANSEEQAGSGQQREVLYMPAGKSLPFMAQMATGFEFGVGQVPGATGKVIGPEQMDPVAQMKMLQEQVAQGAASISLSVSFATLNDDPIGEAAAKNVQLVAVDTPPLPGSPIKLYVGNDNYALGKLLADTLADQLPAGAAGKVVLGSPRNGVPQLDARALGFRERLRERVPKARVVGPLDTDERPDAAAIMWQSITKAQKDAIAFASVGASARILADLRQKQNAKWLAASFDVEPKALEAVKRGELVIVSPEHFLKGAAAGKIQAQYVGGPAELPGGWVLIPGMAVTKKNVDEIISRDASPESQKAYYSARLDEIVGKNGPSLRPLEEAL
jgi:ribose transport system substrate-binding protein